MSRDSREWSCKASEVSVALRERPLGSQPLDSYNSPQFVSSPANDFGLTEHQ